MKILFRKDSDTEQEYKIAKDILGKENVLTSRCEIKNCETILGRYSVLPFYKELEEDLKINNSELLITYSQHRFIADFEYYESLKDLTPKSWIGQGYLNIPETKYGYVVKGKTNSRKWLWDTHMFAENKEALKQVIYNLSADSLIGQQDLVIREYIPLQCKEYGINGLPFAEEEYRLFFFEGNFLCGGHYWSIAEENILVKKYHIGHYF